MARLNYNHLRYFWAVAHNGNLTRTAKQLHVSQSALSLQIRKLEEQLGHELFDRRGKQLVLTEAGRLALEHADAIFRSGTELLSTLRNEEKSDEVLRIGALSTLSRNFQIQFLEPLRGLGNARIVVRSGNLDSLLEQLVGHRLDVILTNLVPPRDSATPWNVRTLDRQPVSLIGYPRHHVEGRALADTLMSAPLVVPTIETAIRTAFDTLTDRLGIAPTIAAEVDDMALLRLMGREDHGLVVVPPIVVVDELQSGQLVELAQLPECTETFYAITLTRRFPNALLKKVIDAQVEDA